MKKKGFLLLVCTLVLITTNYATPQTTRGSRDEFIAQAPTLVAGSEFVFQRKSLETGRISTYTWIIKEKRKYRYKDAYWVDASGGKGDIYWVFDLNFNLMAIFKKGKQIEEISPNITRFKWPLKVGKRWSFSYDFWELDKSGQGVINSVIVKSYEEVAVPAGTFQVFKIFRQGETLDETYYYAPSVGMTVKVELLRTGGKGYLDELKEYSIP
jgi:hypothetical protein